MEMKSLPPWSKVLMALAVVGALVGSQYVAPPLNFKESKKEIAALSQKLEQKQAEIRKGRLARAKLEELQRDIASLEQKLADLKQILPTTAEMGDLLKWINSLADQTNLELVNFTPTAQADQEFLREQPITMEVLGNYHQLGLFFDRISKYVRIINVENVRIQPNKNKKARATIHANFIAKTFVYKEEALPKGTGGGA